MQSEDILKSEQGQLLRSFIERVERLEDEKAEVTALISDVYKEMKETGFNGKVAKRIVAVRSKEDNVVKDEEELFQIYKQALGMT